MGDQETCPLPDDPLLAAWATALNEAGQWAEIFDSEWRFVYMTDDSRLMYGGRVELADVPLGFFSYGPEANGIRMQWGGGQFPLEIIRRGFTAYGPWMQVTALGDEVNEGARLEACATCGRALASKALIERLESEDAAALELDPDRVTYGPLADLPTATEKARRDAPAIAVCDV